LNRFAGGFDSVTGCRDSAALRKAAPGPSDRTPTNATTTMTNPLRSSSIRNPRLGALQLASHAAEAAVAAAILGLGALWTLVVGAPAVPESGRVRRRTTQPTRTPVGGKVGN
jgi:hypothetical protein